jgi:hypothetical protein
MAMATTQKVPAQITIPKVLKLRVVLEILTTTIWICGRHFQNDRLHRLHHRLARKLGRVPHPRLHLNHHHPSLQIQQLRFQLLYC